MSRKRGGAALQKDAPWRQSTVKPVPKIHHSPVLRVAHTPHSSYALSIIKHPNPVERGLATDAILESAGPDCIVPGQIRPVRLLGLKVWPIEVDMKFLEPLGKELKLLGKDWIENTEGILDEYHLISWFMDDAVNLMNKSFIDR